MSKTVSDFRNVDFYCDHAGDIVEIEKKFKVRVDRYGEEQARIADGERCSHMDSCPAVATKAGQSTSFDWTKCLWRQWKIKPPGQ